MSTPKIPAPAKLFVSIMFRTDSSGGETPALLEALRLLEDRFGPADYRSTVLPFDQTAYYQREMGPYINRCYISFKGLVERDSLAGIKLLTNTVEEMTADEGGRRAVNLDPGLLSLENLVLATGKNFSHRIYLSHGIFAEVTLLFQNRNFQPLPWTYPDYASDEVRAILREMRTLLVENMAEARKKDAVPAGQDLHGQPDTA